MNNLNPEYYKLGDITAKSGGDFYLYFNVAYHAILPDMRDTNIIVWYNGNEIIF